MLTDDAEAPAAPAARNGWAATVEQVARLTQAKRRAAERVFYCEQVPAQNDQENRKTGRGAWRWRFECPYCKRAHFHSPYPGHRQAHCTEGPLKASGYVLMLKQSERRAKSKQGKRSKQG